MEMKKDFLPEIPEEFRENLGRNVMVTTIDKIAGWARSNSLWPLTFGTSCCAIEMMSAASAKYDWSRFGGTCYATPGRPDHCSWHDHQQDGACTTPSVRPDTGTQICDCDGCLYDNRRAICQRQLYRCAGGR